jgi:hypothetical protein
MHQHQQDTRRKPGNADAEGYATPERRFRQGSFEKVRF